MEKGLSIAICDDEASSRESMLMMCRAFLEKNGQSEEKIDIYVFSSGREIMASDFNCDILLLDIEMPEQDGICIKEYLEANQRHTRIIFTTSHKERVLEAFGKNVVSFLVKPLCMKEFEKVMEKVLSDLLGAVLEIEENGEILAIPVKQIRYVEAQDKYTLAVTEKREYLVRKTMKFWESILPGQDFVRIHKSYLVNLEYFEKKGEEVLLDNGKRVTISRLRKDRIMETYRIFLRRKAEGI
ncbi:MAG: LytTR family DNA-binding domain-containing protein [Roseburia sp.]|nr:LytTR family DNA-binding domain-containing protein [Roseburia sp.]